MEGGGAGGDKGEGERGGGAATAGLCAHEEGEEKEHVAVVDGGSRIVSAGERREGRGRDDIPGPSHSQHQLFSATRHGHAVHQCTAVDRRV